jgi:hypothetical protein
MKSRRTRPARVMPQANVDFNVCSFARIPWSAWTIPVCARFSDAIAPNPPEFFFDHAKLPNRFGLVLRFRLFLRSTHQSFQPSSTRHISCSPASPVSLVSCESGALNYPLPTLQVHNGLTADRKHYTGTHVFILKRQTTDMLRSNRNYLATDWITCVYSRTARATSLRSLCTANACAFH